MSATTDEPILWTGRPPNGRVPAAGWTSLVPTVIWSLGGAAIFLLWTGLNPFRTPVAWIVVAFFTLPPLVGAIHRLTRPRARDVRYTLTDRHLIVESIDGRHAYDLAALGDLTLDVGRDGLGSIYFRRREALSAIPEWSLKLLATLRRVGLAPTREAHALVTAVTDAPEVFRLINETRHGTGKPLPLPVPSEAPPVHTSLGTAMAGGAVVAANRPSTTPPLWLGLPFIAMGGLTMVLGYGAAEVLAFVIGFLFFGVGVAVTFFAIRAALWPTPVDIKAVTATSVPSEDATKPSAFSMLATGIPWWFGAIFGAAGLGFTIVTISSGAPLWVDIFPLLFVVMGGALAYGSISASLTAHRIRAEGHATIGTVSGVIEANLEVNDAPQYHVVYRYRSVEGVEHQGYSRPMPKAEADRWGIGDQIEVRYDPAMPDRSIAIDEA